EQAAAQETQARERLESSHHPGPVALLLEVSGRCVPPAAAWRRQAALELDRPLETLGDATREGAVRIEPRHLVLVLVGQQLEERAGDGFGERRRAEDARFLRFGHLADER